MNAPPVTQARLRSLIDYDHRTGIFRWKRAAVGVAIGDRAGYQRSDGRWMITVDSNCHAASRWAWLYTKGEWPERHIDHRDNDCSNDRLTNLRLADSSQNMANCNVPRNNRCGIKGVRWDRGRWRAGIRVKGVKTHLGRFDTAQEAGEAYDAAAIAEFGEFARTNALMDSV